MKLPVFLDMCRRVKKSEFVLLLVDVFNISMLRKRGAVPREEEERRGFFLYNCVEITTTARVGEKVEKNVLIKWFS